MKTFYAFIAVFSLFLATATTDSAFHQIVWSCGLMTISYLSGKAFVKRMTKEEKEERA